jgi:hypothetical protein
VIFRQYIIHGPKIYPSVPASQLSTKHNSCLDFLRRQWRRLAGVVVDADGAYGPALLLRRETRLAVHGFAAVAVWRLVALGYAAASLVDAELQDELALIYCCRRVDRGGADVGVAVSVVGPLCLRTTYRIECSMITRTACAQMCRK